MKKEHNVDDASRDVKFASFYLPAFNVKVNKMEKAEKHRISC